MPLSRAFAIVAAVSFLLQPTAGRALDVTACGQLVPTGTTGVLQTDLACTTPTLGCYDCPPKGSCFPTGVTGCTVDGDCAGPDGRCVVLPAVSIERNATLDMNGHAIVAPDTSAVLCQSAGTCTVTSATGRGDISGSVVGIIMRTGKLSVSHVDVHDNVAAGIYSPVISVRMKLADVTANGNGGIGIRASNLEVDGVTANGNGQAGIEANGKIRGTNLTTNDNGWAGTIANKGAKLAGFAATGNGVAPDLGGAGLIVGGATQVTDGTITGNTFDDGSGPAPLDVLTVRKPKLASTTCGHSARYERRTGDLGPTWGVCAGD